MRCGHCGMEVPNTGYICPYCRSKLFPNATQADYNVAVLGALLLIVGGAIYCWYADSQNRKEQNEADKTHQWNTVVEEQYDKELRVNERKTRSEVQNMIGVPSRKSFDYGTDENWFYEERNVKITFVQVKGDFQTVGDVEPRVLIVHVIDPNKRAFR